MTLVITRVQPEGIVLVADSAVTETQFDPPRVLTGVQKLIPINDLGIVISCWGRGSLPNPGGSGPELPLDEWMRLFRDYARAHCNSVSEVASELQSRVDGNVPGWNHGEPKIGFHVAGYENGEPDFWHVHNGPSEIFPAAPVWRVNANHDMAVIRQRGHNTFLGRNGDYHRYAIIAAALDWAVQQLWTNHNLRIPRDPHDLFQMLCLLREHIRLTSSLWRLSNDAGTVTSTVGGPIWGAVIRDGRIVHFELDERSRPDLLV